MRDRVRWLAVPLAAYLVITLALPAANGAATHHAFAHHAMWVIVGCILVVAAIVAIGAALELSLAGFRRLANNRTSSRVSPGGKS
jgi:hypothetical protein